MNHNPVARDLKLNAFISFAKLRKNYYACHLIHLSSLFFYFISLITFPLISFASNTASSVTPEINSKPETSAATTVKTNKLSENKNSNKFKKWSGEFSVDINNESAENETKKSNLTKLNLNSKIQYLPSDYFGFMMSPFVRFKSGFQTKEESTITNSNGNKTDLFFKEASFDISFHISSSVKAATMLGAVDQNRYSNSILIKDKTFPSIILTTGNKNHFYSKSKLPVEGTEAFVQYSIPTSEGLKTETNELEPAPQFISAGLASNFNLGSMIKIDFKTSYFQFKNTPTLVSTQSGFWGNTTESINATQSKLKYEPAGVQALIGTTILFNTNWSYNINAQFVNNQQAPEDSSKSVLLSNSILWDINKNWSFTPGYKYYRIDSDSTVSYYLDPVFETNRVGHQIDLTAENKNMFKLALGYREENPIYESFFQSRNQILFIKLETGYADF